MSSYGAFLESKIPTIGDDGREASDVSEVLFPFQRDVVRRACRKGRFGIFADCGMGKTLMQLEWLRHMTSRRSLIVAPLAVAEQTIAEAGMLEMDVRRVSDPTDDTFQVVNYQKLHRFIGAEYDAIVLDESSILKSLDGKTRGMLLREFVSIPYRLCCTATPAPNDVSELANHAEFLGAMPRAEMLASFFVHDTGGAGTVGGWRLKKHAQDSFWEWVASWAVYIRKPSDLGYDDGDFVLPDLEIKQDVIDVEIKGTGRLFGVDAGIAGARAARKGSISQRVESLMRLLSEHDDQAIVWCGLNDEGRQLATALGAEAVLIEGATPDDDKVAREGLWRAGQKRVLITKPQMFGFGLNWQHCRRVYFLGIGHSYEQYYQAIRRCWRFGQKHPVDVVIVTTEAESDVAATVRRKERDAALLAEGVVERMGEVMRETKARKEYTTEEEFGEGWEMKLGDCCERISEVKDDSVGLSVFSPPFAALYTYSASERDLGNAKDYDQFFQHFGYMAPELLRVTMPGRRACVHVQQVSTTKATHGVIGWRDFRADVVKLFVSLGWIYDGEVVIDKDPQAQAIRTKSKALMFVQKNKDSAWSRPAMADYILLFRKPGSQAVSSTPGAPLR